MENVKRLVQDCKAAGLPMASHDDDSAEKVAEMRELGISIAEFPVEMTAAKAAAAAGMHVVMGAPNVLRGVSNSGNLRALDAIGANAADVLCSDYYTPSMIHAVFALFRSRTLTLPRAAAMASLNAARAVGLDAGARIDRKGEKSGPDSCQRNRRRSFRGWRLGERKTCLREV